MRTTGILIGLALLLSVGSCGKEPSPLESPGQSETGTKSEKAPEPPKTPQDASATRLPPGVQAKDGTTAKDYSKTDRTEKSDTKFERDARPLEDKLNEMIRSLSIHSLMVQAKDAPTAEKLKATITDRHLSRKGFDHTCLPDALAMLKAIAKEDVSAVVTLRPDAEKSPFTRVADLEKRFGKPDSSTTKFVGTAHGVTESYILNRYAWCELFMMISEGPEPRQNYVIITEIRLLCRALERPSPQPASRMKGEVDMVTFIKTFAEGNADKYKGFVVRGGGGPGNRSSEKGRGAEAFVLVCGKRPDGTYYAIRKEPGTNNYNFDASKDRMYGVKLVWLEGKMPEGYESGGAGLIFGIEGLCESFQARFEGQYTTATISSGGEGGRLERVPVLIWIAK